ncbi:MAG: (Fe-S)-binding protein [Candidatus Neomarinimicrobiota bacterium]
MVAGHQYLTGDDVRLLQECIHCGLCLSACPTYLVTGVEAESPRGRLELMKALDRNEVPPAPAFAHLDQCLGCLACRTACPAGVNFGRLLETSRSTQRPGLVSRLALALVTVPSRLKVLSLLLKWLQALRLDRLLINARLLPRSLRYQVAGLPRLKGLPFTASNKEEFPSAHPGGVNRGRVALFTGCVMDQWYQPVHAATVRLLNWNGFDVVIPTGLGCCGALHAHSGLTSEAQVMLSQNRAALARIGVQAIVVNAAGCGAQLRDHLWTNGKGPPVMDVSVFLADNLTEPPGFKLPGATTYDAPCHLFHAQQVSVAPLKLLETACKELHTLPDADQCCGSAGLFSVVQGRMSRQVLARKIEQLRSLDAVRLVTANPGCQMQLQAGLRTAGLPLEVYHLCEILDQAYQQDPAYRRTFQLTN